MAVEKVGLYHDRRKGKPWTIRWFGENDEQGKPRRYSKAFKLKRDAISFRAVKQKEFDGGTKRDRIEITIGVLCDKFLKNNKHRFRHSSYQRYKLTISQLEKFFSSNHLIRKIRREDAEEFIATLEIVHPIHKRLNKRLSAAARNRHLDCAKAIFGTAVDYEYISKNPFTGIKKGKSTPRPWHFVAPDQFKAILTTTPQPRLRALYGVIYGCGLRYGEAVNLLWNGKDIDFERGRINIAN